MDMLASFLGRGGFLPHGYCFTWTPGLLWSMVGADAVIATAYFSIPLAIVSFLRKRPDAAMKGVAWLFSAFIFACGVTHVMDVWTIWQPDYGLQALTKMATAAISIVTAIALWPLIPKALKIPSVSQLQSVIKQLEAEVHRRRTVEGHLGDVEQSLAVTLASVEAGFITTDREGRVTRMNAIAEEVTGWTQADAVGRILWEVLVHDDGPLARTLASPVDAMIEQGIDKTAARRTVAISSDGRRTVIELKAALTHADDGSVRGLAMVFRDMTRLIQAEAESTRLAAIVESSNDAIIGMALDGRITSWNRGAQSMLAYPAEEVIGQPGQMLVRPSDQAEASRVLADLARGAHVPPFEAVRLAKDGTPLHVSVTISPIRDSRGTVVGVSTIARDVSHLRRAEAALHESEARLRFTLEAAQIGDWDLNLATGIARRSLWHDRCFGYDRLQEEWSVDIFLRHVHPDDRAQVVRRMEAGTAARKGWSGEYRVVWPDASIHWVRTHCTIQQEGGQPAHLLGIVTDITQQKLAEDARLNAQRLEAENRQILEANRLKSQFLANMSHELRTPLNAIIGFADLLHSGAVNADSLKHQVFLGHIGTSGRHLLRLINDLLDLSKVESGKFRFFPEPVNLSALVKDVTDTLDPAIRAKRIVLRTQIDPALSELVLDPARMKQVLYNYLSNAIKFTPERGRVTIRARPEGASQFRLEVEDTGVGIAPADLPRLFAEFQQLDTSYSKQHQGTGLGLALTRRLVQAQGGSVGVRSVLGQGSVFHLVLGRVLPAEAEPAQAAELRGRRVLVIEDDGRDQARIVQSLSDAGFQVEVAATGEQALLQAQGQAYDAIMLDLLLPDQSGLKVLATLRSHGPNRDSPVVGITLPVEPRMAATFAIANVLSKPIQTQEVVSAMARFRGPQRRAKVMVIDDDPAALDLMRATLASIDIDTVCLASGRQALLEIDGHRPDAIILDLMMPEFDGFAVLDALRQMPDWRDTPVYVWTSMLLTSDEYASLARTARGILSKGGGELAVMLDDLRRWRASVTLPPERSET